MNCEVCNRYISSSDGSEPHTFSGLGFRIAYCPLHCPKSLDGTKCRKEHPPENKVAEANE